MTISTKNPKTNPKWLSLTEAADLLGVHFSTLRRWADQGKIAHIRTPGGMRRFAQRDLEDFLRRNQRGGDRPAAQKHPTEIGPISIQIPQDREDWMQKFGEVELIKLRGTGQMMFGLLMQYIARNENQSPFLEEAKHIAWDIGVICARSGLTVKEVVKSFLVFRSKIIEMVLNTSSIHHSLDAKGKQLNKRTNDYMDAMLLAVITGYSESYVA